MESIDNLRLSLEYWLDCTFNSTKILNCDIVDSLNKPKIVRSCIFPLSNIHFELSLDYVPAPIVAEDHQNIAYFIYQSSIVTLNKIEQEEPQTGDKQILFYRGF